MSSTSSVTADVSTLRPTIPTSRIVVCVADACDELWTVQNVSDATYGLGLLHGALVRDRADAYDPSDVFHCIQAAALNFPGSWEHAVWAVATLVRTCVGPAWRMQRSGGVFVNYGSTATTLSESTGESGSPRQSQSPRSFSPLSIDPHQLQYPYPYIPEVLPGAILRLAAKAPRESRSIAEAQRELVLALCCFESFDHQNKETEWTLLGAHEPVETMMRFWLETVTCSIIKVGNDGTEIREPQVYPILLKSNESGAQIMERLQRRTMDWWYTLNIARASSDLVAAGWRPHLKGHDIILHLLDIVEQGITLRNMSPTAAHKVNRKERLAAVSSGAEAISALTSLGSRGLLSLSCVENVIDTLLKLQIVAGKSPRHAERLYPRGFSRTPDEEHEWHQEFETFLQQRGLCFVDSAELLWVLLAQEVSSHRVMASLLAVKFHDLERAAVVVRVVSGALWGKSPESPRIPSLRIYWNNFLVLLQALAVSCLESLKIPHNSDDSVVCSRQLMTLCLEVVVALGRMVSCELIRGVGTLASDEWDSVLRLLRTVIMPCLRFDADLVDHLDPMDDDVSPGKVHNIWKMVKSECETVIMKLGEHLKQFTRFQIQRFHSISSDTNRDELHFCLLREATQVVSRPTSLAINVIRSWAAVGFSPCRRATWVDTASAIVADAFAVHQDLSSSRFGGYVHSPLVRLEALLQLSNDDVYASPLIDGESNQTIMTPTVSAGRDFSDLFFASPLSATRQEDNEYTKLVGLVVLPSLSLVFNCVIGKDGIGKIRYFTDTAEPGEVMVDSHLRMALSKQVVSDYDNGNFRLRNYSVQLMGRLFCSELGRNDYKTQLLQVLTQTALNQSERLTLEPGQAACSVTNRALLSLAAIGQIDRCMCSPFHSFPQNHSALPGVIDALCFILRRLCNSIDTDMGELSHNKQQEYSFRILMFAALLPLARLRKSNEGGLLLVEREEAVIHLPDDIAALLCKKERDILDGEGPVVAPFVYVKTELTFLDQPTVTLISFEPIVTALIQTLAIPWSHGLSEDVPDCLRSQDLENRFRSSCYDALTNLTFSGLASTNPNLVAILLDFSKKEGPYSATEYFARLRAILAILQMTVQHSKLQTNVVTGSVAYFPWDNVNRLVAQVLQLCLSRRSDEVTSGCKLLIGIFPCLAAGRLDDIESLRDLFSRMLTCLLSRTNDCVQISCENNLLGNRSTRDDNENGPALLLVLYECCLYYVEFFGCVDSDVAKPLVRVCYDVASKLKSSQCCRTLAVKCAVTVLNGLNDRDVDELMNEYFKSPNDDFLTDAFDKSCEVDFLESHLVLSALSFRSIVSHADGTVRNQLTKVKDHFELALECEHLSAFDKDKDTMASWLCGDHLLTCKVGGIISSRCGWIEITIRGATFRHRELLRLSDTLSLENPDLSQLMWTQAKSFDQDRASCHDSLDFSQLQGDENALKGALSLLRRCDRVLGIQTPIETNAEGCVSHYPDMKAQHPTLRYPLHNHMSSSCSTAHDEKESSNLSIQSLVQSRGCNSIRSWLSEILGNVFQVEQVAERISQMGLDDALDCDDVTNVSRCNSKRFELHPIVRINNDEKAARDIALLDRTVVLDTHKIALLFAGASTDSDGLDQDEVDYLLKVKFASPIFYDFCQGLGDVVMARHLKYFSGGFDTSGTDTDGTFALIWIENSGQSGSSSSFLTIFHAVAYMPPNLNNRKRHVGNDSVHIVFCDPTSLLHERVWAGGIEEESENILISGEFGFVTIFVIPTSEGFFRVKVQLRPCLPNEIKVQLHHLPGEDIVSVNDAPNFVRRLANLADIACSAVTHDTLGPTTSWEIRLRQLRQLKRHAMVKQILT